MDEIVAILKTSYLFNVTTLEPIDRRAVGLQDTFTIYTPNGLFFLKCFDKPENVVLRSTKLNQSLNELDYPAVKIIPDQNGDLVNKIQNKCFAVYEYVDIKEPENITLSEAQDFGRQLGLLHSLTKDIECEFDVEETFNSFYDLANEPGVYKDKLNDTQKEVVAKLKENLEAIAVRLPEMQRLLSHGEYTVEHTRFRGGKVYKIIDWDGVGLDYPILDLGMATTFCIKQEIIDFEVLKKFLSGYFEKNNLYEGERSLIYEGMLYGASKFILWSLSEPEINERAFQLFNILLRNQQDIKTIVNKIQDI